MMKKTLISAMTATLTLLCGMSALSQAYAQQTLGVSISPPVNRVTVLPGKTVTLAYNITNTGEQDIMVTPSVVDFSADEKTGKQVLHSSSSIPVTLANADKTIDTPFLLKRDSKDQVVIQATFPEANGEKDYYETLLLKLEPIQENNLISSQSKVTTYVGANMLISVTKTGKDLGELTLNSFQMPRIIDMFSNIPIQLTAKNTGKTYTTANGTVEIYSLFGKQVKTYQILPEDILVNSVRQLHSSENDTQESRDFVAKDFVYSQPFFLGLYTVKVDVHAPNQQSMVTQKTVLALPLSPIIILSFGVVAFLVVKNVKRN